MRYPLIVVLLVLTIILGLGLGVEPEAANAGIGDWSLHGYADMDSDCDVDVVDAQTTAFRYGASSGSPFYDTKHDVEPFARHGYYDGDIDIKDLQFVFGRMFFTCKEFWDPQTSMGSYSYKSSSSCSGSSNYVDPVTVVFTNIATTLNKPAASRLEEALRNQGLPVVDHDGEQRFWEMGECTYEDVDAAENDGGCYPTEWPPCPSVDVWDRIHCRAEIGAGAGWTWSEYWGEWYLYGGHPDWETLAVATPHFDDDDNTCGHYVPEDYPYWNDLCPSCTGSGFDAGREWIRQQFGTPIRIEYWGNTRPVPQRCGDNQWPSSDGWVYYEPVN